VTMSTLATILACTSSAFLMFVAGAVAISAKYQAEYYSKLTQPVMSKFIFLLWWLPWGLAAVILVSMIFILRARRQKIMSIEQSNAIAISVLSSSVAIFVLYIIGSLFGFLKLWILIN